MKSETTQKHPPHFFVRKVAFLLLLIFAGFVAADGYFNKWRTATRALHWNVLVLHERNGTQIPLKARRNFTLLKIADIRTATVPESLVVFDRPLADSGYYRLYFRFSDTASHQLERMSQTISAYDTAGVLKRSVEDIGRFYRTLKERIGGMPSSPPDTLVHPPGDSSKVYSSLRYAVGNDDGTQEALKKVLGSPQVIVGVGLGVALSAGTDILSGNAYCAVSKSDVFHLDSLQSGPYAGTWEGLSIDILWAMRKKEAGDTLAVSDTLRPSAPHTR